jgi:ABC-type glycerol-3-phosphate transport system substrate-binding protein
MGHNPARLTRRSFVQTVAGATSAVLLAACGQAAPPPTAAPPAAQPAAPAAATPVPAATTPPTKQTTEVRFNHRTGQEDTIFVQMEKTFNQMHPEITFKNEQYSGANQEYFQKMAVLIAGGTEGDLIWMSSIEGFYDYASRDVWLAVDDLIARDKVDAGQWFKAAVDMMSVGGKTYGLPLWSHPSVVGLFYNQDLVDKEGIKISGDLTYDQLLGYAKQLTKQSGGKTDQYGFEPQRGYFNGIGQVILAYGGKIISDDGKKMTFSEPPAKAALKWMSDVYNTAKVAPIPGTADDTQLIVNSKLATWSNGVWGYWSASAWKFNWGAAIMPKGPGGTHGSMLQTDTIPISKRSKNVDASWLFQQFTASKDASPILLDNNYVTSSRADILNDPKAKAVKGLQPFLAGLSEAVALPKPANYRLRELEIAINQVTDNLWLGKMTVDEVAAAVDKAGQEVLDKPAGTG